MKQFEKHLIVPVTLNFRKATITINAGYKTLLVSVLTYGTNLICLRLLAVSSVILTTALNAILDNMVMGIGKYKDYDVYLPLCKERSEQIAKLPVLVGYGKLDTSPQREQISKSLPLSPHRWHPGQKYLTGYDLKRLYSPASRSFRTRYKDSGHSPASGRKP